MIVATALVATACGGGRAQPERIATPVKSEVPVTRSKPEPIIVPGIPITLAAAEQEAIKQDVRSQLKDPESAKFGTMVAVRDRENASRKVVCGKFGGAHV